MPDSICVIGLGYIGLPTAAMFASHGFQVHGVDINPSVVESIHSGSIQLQEPGLKELVQEAVAGEKLTVSDQVIPADVFILAVPTPLRDKEHPDLSFLESAIEQIAPHVQEGNLVILESTSPVGTTRKLCEWLAELREDLALPHNSSSPGVLVSYCPERVLPGNILHELVHNDRVIGGLTEESTNKSAELYRSFVKGECVTTNSQTAEMAKLSENAFRDVNIAFANELSMICDENEIDVNELIAITNRHPRVNILKPGPGVGGHCIAVDPWFIVSQSQSNSKLLKTARMVNNAKTDWVFEKITAAVDTVDAVGKVKVSCLGLAYKPDVSDTRESPALDIVNRLRKSSKLEVSVCEPNLGSGPGGVELSTLEDSLASADIIVQLVAHREFESLDLPESSLFLNFA